MYERRYPVWRNRNQSGSPTPWNAATGQHIEDGLVEVSAKADAAEAELEGRLSEAELSTTFGEVATTTFGTLSVADFGAVGDGVTNDTAAIKAAIAASDGRRVVADGSKSYAVDSIILPSGTYFDGQGARFIQRNPTGGSQPGAAIRNEHLYGTTGSPDSDITLTNLTIVIGTQASGRPVSFSGVNGVRVSGIRILKSPDATTTDFMLNFRSCTDVVLSNFVIDNAGELFEDGLHITGCSNVVVDNGLIRSGDDSISITQELNAPYASRNIQISNVKVFSKRASFIKVLVEAGEANGIDTVVLSNITGESTSSDVVSGTGMIISDASNSGKLRNVHLSNVVIDGQKKAGNGATISNVIGLFLHGFESLNNTGVAAAFSGCSHVTVNGMLASPKADAVANDLITFVNCDKLEAFGIHALSAKGHAIRISGAATGALAFVGCVVDSPAQSAMQVNGSVADIEIMGLRVTGGGNAISFDAAAVVTAGSVIGGAFVGVAANFANIPPTVAVVAVKGTAGIINRLVGNMSFYGVAAVARPAAYTQTYATTTRTVAAYTPDVESTAYTGSPADAAATAKLADLNALRVAVENLRLAVENDKQVTNQIIDDLQAVGLLQ